MTTHGNKHEFLQHIASENDMLQFAGKLAKAVENGAVIFLYGPLGAGKTTFTRGFLRALGYHHKVKSPTYTLVEPYELSGKTVYHFDFYRLRDANELEHIGIKEYFRPDSICLIEWPEKGFPLLPAPDLACYIEIKGQGRDIRLESQSRHGEEILAQINR